MKHRLPDPDEVFDDPLPADRPCVVCKRVVPLASVEHACHATCKRYRTPKQKAVAQAGILSTAKHFSESPAYQEVLAGVPLADRATFTALVADYCARGIERFGRSHISYALIADLVRDGWRKGTT